MTIIKRAAWAGAAGVAAAGWGLVIGWALTTHVVRAMFGDDWYKEH